MVEGREYYIKEAEVNREIVLKRWKALKNQIEKAKIPDFDTNIELPESDEWEKWKDWDKIFNMLNKQKHHHNYAMLFQKFRPNYNPDILETDGLAIAFMTNSAFYNKLRKDYPTEEYKDEWNTFFKMYGKRLGSASINIHRTPELNYEGYDFSGINPEPFLNEFANCRGASFEGSDLSGGYLKAVDFSGANLKGTNFDGAFLLNSKFDNALMDEETTTFHDAGIGTMFDNGMPEWARKQTKQGKIE